MRCDLSNEDRHARVLPPLARLAHRWTASRAGILASACLATLLLAGAAGSAYSASEYTPVTDARLANPEPANWLMIRGNYKGWSYSTLDQINTSNVKNLVPVWSFSTGVDQGHEAPPIVNNGIMFVSMPYSQVLALDALTGDLIWRYKRKLPPGFSALHNTSRGVALYGDKVYFQTLDAVLVALDAKTGKVTWEATVEDWKTGYYNTAAPLVVKGKVLVGIAGGEFGVRGFVQAFDAETGKSVWKTYTVPAPGEPGSDTWQKPDTWKTGGASTWMTGTYDPEANVSIGAPATLRLGSVISGREIICTRPPQSRSTATPVRSRAISSTTRTSRGTGMRWVPRCWWISRRMEPPQGAYLKRRATATCTG
jgi:alcohol dehydrogenase (cytochrome c)